MVGRHRRRQCDHQRDGQAQGVGAGDDQHRDGALDGGGHVAQAPPHQEGDGAGGGGHIEQPGGEPVGQRLGPAAARLRLGHQPLDPGQGRVVPDGIDPDAERRIGRHGAGDHPVTGPAGDGARLAGDHRLVELHLPVHDHAVGRHPASGTDQHHVSRHEGGQVRELPAVEGQVRDLRGGDDLAHSGLLHVDERSLGQHRHLLGLGRHRHAEVDRAGGGDRDARPSGLRGEQIPLWARIVAVADAYANLTTDRPLAPGRTSEQALVELEKASGIKYDGMLVRILARELKAERTMPNVGS